MSEFPPTDTLLMDAAASGVYGRAADFEVVLDQLSAAITLLTRTIGSRVETMRFPPVISRRTIERCGYLHKFPHLLGSVHTFTGDDVEHGQLVADVEAQRDWGTRQTLTDLVLTPAACYAVYPRMAGVLASGDRTVDVESWCFRQELSHSPERMRAFRMREFVHFSGPGSTCAWRDQWLERSEKFLCRLGLQATVSRATDAFFGTGARFLATSQLEQALKYEVRVDVGSGINAAVISCNYHLDHFSEIFDIRLPEGQPAHTACVGFGMERLALALSSRYGAVFERWPADVRSTLLTADIRGE